MKTTEESNTTNTSMDRSYNVSKSAEDWWFAMSELDRICKMYECFGGGSLRITTKPDLEDIIDIYNYHSC